MDENRVSVKQLAALVFCALLSPLIRVVPGEASAIAGAGGWLSPLLALPVFLLVLWALIWTFRRLPRDAGLSGLYRLAFGKRLGKGMTLLTGLWLLLLSAVALRFYVESVISSVYSDSAMWLFLIGLMAVVWYVCRLGTAAVCRMAQVFLYVLGITMALVILLGVRETHLYHVWPFWLEGASKLAKSAVPVLIVLGYGVPILFARGEAGQTEAGGRTLFFWTTALCVLMSVTGLVILGMFGWQTSVRMQMPFFSVAKEVSVLDVIERVESVVAAVWVLSDVALIAGLMDTAADYLQKGLRPFDRRIILTVSAAAVILLAAFLTPSSFQLRKLWEGAIKYGDGAVCMGVPLAACLSVRLRRKI